MIFSQRSEEWKRKTLTCAAVFFWLASLLWTLLDATGVAVGDEWQGGGMTTLFIGLAVTLSIVRANLRIRKSLVKTFYTGLELGREQERKVLLESIEKERRKQQMRKEDIR